MSKELAKKQEGGALATYKAPEVEQEVLSSDMVIPKVLLMQALSDNVSERKKDPVTGAQIQAGDIVRSTSGEILGNPEKPVDIIPLRLQNLWMLQEQEGKEMKFRGYIPRTAGLDDAKATTELEKTGENLPWEFKHLGADWKRTKVIRLFALLPADIKAFQEEMKKAAESGEMPDLEKTLLPVVIDFRVSSYNAGKEVATYFLKIKEMAQYGARPYGYSMALSVQQDKNDKGTFYVFKTGKTTKLPAELKPEAERWYNTLANVQVKVDESDANEPAKAHGESGVSEQSAF